MKSLEYSSVEPSEGRQKRRRLAILFHRHRRLFVLASVWLFVCTVAVVFHRQRQGSGSEQSLVDSNNAGGATTTLQPTTSKPTLASVDTATPPPQTIAPTPVTPTPEPSIAPVPPSPEFCDSNFDCQTDRLGHNSRLYPGQAICNHQYMFGMTKEGCFQWMNCETKEVKVFHNKTILGVVYFSMQEDAAFQVWENETEMVLWRSQCTKTVTVYPQCLTKPLFDCPYLHLHKDGVVVLNWIDGGAWIAENIKKVYEKLYSD